MQVTDSELKSRAHEGREFANNLNRVLRETNLRDLLQHKKVVFTMHNCVANGTLGDEYKKGTEHWLYNGALAQLIEILEKKPKFIGGSLGSVWQDVTLKCCPDVLRCSSAVPASCAIAHRRPSSNLHDSIILFENQGRGITNLDASLAITG